MSAVSLAVAAALFCLPGLAFSLAAGLRGWLAVGTAPVTTLAVAAAASALVRATGVSWQITTAALAWLGLCVLAFLLLGRHAPKLRLITPTTPRAWAPVASLVAAGIVGASIVWRSTGAFTRVNQSWDALFHSSAIRLIADSGVTDPNILASIAQPANTNFFYPNLYHTVAALHFEIVGAGITSTTNGILAALPFLFALSTVGLLASLDARTSTMVLGALVAVSVSAFPYIVIVHGALFPFSTALAAAPGLVALAERLVREPSVTCAVVIGLSGSGLLLTHPSVAVVAAVWCAAHVAVAWSRGLMSGRLLGVVAVAVVVAGIGSVSLLRTLSSGVETASSVQLPPFSDGGSAVGRLLLFSTNMDQPQWWVGGSVLAGFVLCLHRRALWSSYVIAGCLVWLFVLSFSYDSTLTTLWWDDYARFAALFVMPAVIFAAFFLGAATELIARQLARAGAGGARAGSPRARQLATGAAAVAVVLVAGFLTSWGYQERQMSYLRFAYSDGPTVSPGEQEAYAFLAEQPGAGTVLNDPQDGSPYAYSVYDVPVLFMSPLTPPFEPSQIGPARLLLLERFRYFNTDEAVVEALDQLEVRWVVVGEGFLVPGILRAPGLADLEEVAGLDKIFDNGDAQVYELPSSGQA